MRRRSRLIAGLQRARTLGGDPLGTGLLFALSELESRAGQFAKALDYARRGLAASAQTGQVTERSVLLFAEALALAHLGDEAARPSALEGLRSPSAPSSGSPRRRTAGRWGCSSCRSGAPPRRWQRS